jgi:hypothetical protein
MMFLDKRRIRINSKFEIVRNRRYNPEQICHFGVLAAVGIGVEINHPWIFAPVKIID